MLTTAEHETFERDGYLVVEDALPAALVDELTTLCDRFDAEYRKDHGLDEAARISIIDFVGKHPRFVELLDWPLTFPKVWGILGWNIQLYHSHLVVSPPDPTAPQFMAWHQDSGRLNDELETAPRPRISLKVGYFLTDTTELGRANFYVVPGSQLRDEIDVPRGSSELPEGATPVCVKPGSAVFFDRRTWHTASRNEWDRSRKVLFYGYSYRWLRPRDDVTIRPTDWEDRDAIQRQLLGASATGGYGYTSPTDDDVPLRAWLEANGAEAPFGRVPLLNA